jgi:GxxExxY protein
MKNSIRYSSIPVELNSLGKKIVDSAFTVHSKLGPGLLEKVYQVCLCYELQKRGINYQRQIDIPIHYDGLRFDEGLRLDIWVERNIIIEIKATDLLNPYWEAQIISYLRLTGNRLGYLINFNVPRIREGIRRYVV